MSLPLVTLKVRRTSSHPWIYRKMVRPSGEAAPGEFVEIRDKDGAFVGRGFYNPRSEIALRVLTTDASEDSLGGIVEGRLGRALELRRDLLRLEETTDAYRLVHAEGDGLSGLVVDRYGGRLVCEIFALGFFRARSLVREKIQALITGASVVFAADDAAERREGFRLERERPAAPVRIREGGLEFLVSPGGHKTGFFLDQRDNRLLLGARARGREVLDCFTYTGGFALHAARGGAKRVVGVDLDEQALLLARENARRNGLAVRFEKADVFDFLRGLPKGERFDVIILDPSKQARVKAETSKALKAYRDMNLLALERLRPGGLLLSCSCSGLVSEAMFMAALKEAAAAARRDLSILEARGAAADHPVSLNCPETRYLKAVWSVLRAQGRP